MAQIDDGPRLALWCHANPDDAAAEIERLRGALKDIQEMAVGVKPPRHTWYYDRAETALAGTNGDQ